jgi:hypothetical protein
MARSDPDARQTPSRAASPRVERQRGRRCGAPETSGDRPTSSSGGTCGGAFAFGNCRRVAASGARTQGERLETESAMPRESKTQKETVGRVMHEFKHGELTSGSGKKVKTPRQAVAIALSEAGASNQQSPAENKRPLRRTKEKERRGVTAQAEAEGRRSRSH